jgi:hypothetical protein
MIDIPDEVLAKMCGGGMVQRSWEYIYTVMEFKRVTEVEIWLNQDGSWRHNAKEAARGKQVIRYIHRSLKKQNRKGEAEASYRPTKQGAGPGQTRNMPLQGNLHQLCYGNPMIYPLYKLRG